ncbi:hypothetical protein WN51_04768 [Melipona quadrifasciata]|uniref:Uncharacterized protein n=1 Tax=Melipona quadrifasciata TaxID=166423 RepID=A0A0M8ZSQ9_9HYME|nr:hypothetical protein WN51_04768 [Melipona quadrifasciata]
MFYAFTTVQLCPMSELGSFDVYTDLIITVLSPELVSADASAHAHERSNPVSSIFCEIACNKYK